MINTLKLLTGKKGHIAPTKVGNARVKVAQHAFRVKSLEATKAAHTKQAISQADEEHKEGTHVGDFVYGAIDGSVTTFAVVSGVAGAALSTNIVIILGLANLIGDGISMAVGNYLSSKSEKEFVQSERKREEWEIDHYPQGEIEEIREIFRKKGFKGKQLEGAVATITSNKKVWVDTMMTEELGLNEDPKSPVMKGWVTFLSFVAVGSIPLIPYLLGLFIDSIQEFQYPLSVGMTFFTFFLIGSAKTYVTGKSWWKSGAETLFVGALAAIAAYGVGYFLRGLA
ncbi:MAG TPA: VIT1/CCC1 transporter family protein [Candidatus Nanoarchaeia archaeon]|nr:VIT1/CCC1 transporter family protein [Candidatus Nanoarchaeia archaeon]